MEKSVKIINYKTVLENSEEKSFTMCESVRNYQIVLVQPEGLEKRLITKNIAI
jgi:hypothetical protein